MNTLDKSIVASEASSVAVTSAKALPTTGPSSTAVTVTAKTSSTVRPLEVPVTVTKATPLWSAW